MRWIKLQVIILFVFLCAHAHGFNSKKEWQTYKETNSMSVCFDQGFEKMLWDKSAWCNVTLPDIFNNNTLNVCYRIQKFVNCYFIFFFFPTVYSTKLQCHRICRIKYLQEVKKGYKRKTFLI